MMKSSVQEIVDLRIDIGMSADDENKKVGHKEHYHLEVENEDPEDQGYFAPPTSIIQRSSSRYRLKKRLSKRSISVSEMFSLELNPISTGRGGFHHAVGFLPIFSDF